MKLLIVIINNDVLIANRTNNITNSNKAILEVMLMNNSNIETTNKTKVLYPNRQEIP